jgi:hypothetical protein
VCLEWVKSAAGGPSWPTPWTKVSVAGCLLGFVPECQGECTCVGMAFILGHGLQDILAGQHPQQK